MADDAHQQASHGSYGAGGVVGHIHADYLGGTRTGCDPCIQRHSYSILLQYGPDISGYDFDALQRTEGGALRAVEERQS